MAGPALLLNSLVQCYGNHRALDLHPVVLDGGSTAVLGPNGSGKSTLLRLAATVDKPTSGSVSLAGLDPADPTQRTALRRRLGYVAQHNGLPGRMRVREYCDYVAALKEIGPARLRRRWTSWVLDRVDLTDRIDDRIGTLSEGMKRRLSIAQALLGGPDYLVLDEPLTSLDAEQRGNLTQLLLGFASEVTVLMATHQANELASVCRRVIVLKEGRIAFDGTPIELQARGTGHVWQTHTLHPDAACRAIGPDLYQCVAAVIPSGATPTQPTLNDGYLAVIKFDTAG